MNKTTLKLKTKLCQWLCWLCVGFVFLCGEHWNFNLHTKRFKFKGLKFKAKD